MVELELTLSKEDRRTYVLGDLGSITLARFFGPGATIQASGHVWRADRDHFWSRVLRLVDEAGNDVALFEPNTWRRGGTIRWAERPYPLRAASSWRERYALYDGERELALLSGKGWGRQPVSVQLEDPSVEPALVLFAAFVVRRLADDAGGAAAGASAAVA